MRSLRFRKGSAAAVLPPRALKAPGGTGSGPALFRPLAGKMPAMLDDATPNDTMKLSTRS